MSTQSCACSAAQFLVLYKRGGQRVIINAHGDMLVRPSFIEVSVRSGGAPPGVTDSRSEMRI